LAIVVLGGLGSQLGVALAALVMIGGGELFRDFAEYRMLIFGVALVVMMVLRPRGLVSGRTPSIALGRRKEISAELVAQGRG
jgi:branched-chain amino acid transport system permease protein